MRFRVTLASAMSDRSTINQVSQSIVDQSTNQNRSMDHSNKFTPQWDLTSFLTRVRLTESISTTKSRTLQTLWWHIWLSDHAHFAHRWPTCNFALYKNIVVNVTHVCQRLSSGSFFLIVSRVFFPTDLIWESGFGKIDHGHAGITVKCSHFTVMLENHSKLLDLSRSFYVCYTSAVANSSLQKWSAAGCKIRSRSFIVSVRQMQQAHLLINSSISRYSSENNQSINQLNPTLSLFLNFSQFLVRRPFVACWLRMISLSVCVQKRVKTDHMSKTSRLINQSSINQ